jgi:hypothetical protein
MEDGFFLLLWACRGVESSREGDDFGWFGSDEAGEECEDSEVR